MDNPILQKLDQLLCLQCNSSTWKNNTNHLHKRSMFLQEKSDLILVLPYLGYMKRNFNCLFL